MNNEHVHSDTRLDKPEADAVEQEQPAFPVASQDFSPAVPPDVSEADYVEQHLSALQDDGGGLPPDRLGAEANEADLAEQAHALPADGEDDYQYGAVGNDLE
jgi:hypothetical protein